ncbi:MAG: SPOR domain-containing protein [Dysgonamonadaceae bacterium]|nr:SPOR domain-containing protein [Dysgonamonadaceae bacterium]
MKTKIFLLGLIVSLMFSLASCKTKESAYKAAYEAAKEKEMQENTPVEVTPVDKTPDQALIQKEKVVLVDGAGLLKYSVVIGSFLNKTNAVSLKERMDKQGFKSSLAQNEKGMFRVIAATYSEKSSAASERNRVKEKYYPEFQDAWLLENN